MTRRRTRRRRSRLRTAAVLVVVLAAVAGAAYAGLKAVRGTVDAIGSSVGDSLGNALGSDRGTSREPLSETLGPTTPELSYDGFDPSDIIADDLFFDADAMSEQDVADFIAQWNDGCVTGSDGTPCLADYEESTPTYQPDQYCAGGFTGSGGDTAASIITKAAQGCGISPKVLLVMMQKEQGLLTASGADLGESRYRTAMGFACPDNGACDPDYFGFTRQVWFAARQFRVYEADAETFNIRAGQSADILYNPTASCGSATVEVANQATADLYNYTPYQPNEAALAGSGDDCSAWGNLNFYAYWKAWFGPTR
ncbi:MAG: hemagglutinin [Actinomyces sp.]|nr:hemagglutinin [Actinomyces sp.]MCI1642289.1 hemagglutinin [Actinomyces sp.]MCI1662779.1 hemagglutinin [Actinomyces sp.]MCI1691382.1 hemagglutinin [Actinomyces sp.]MCI1788148.1 hemagglutinin [Actinomyces sp.]MCI1830295.1 hemagglutinin [Actinomyces sp.]